MNLEDKIAIVTCGASGIGKEIVRSLLQNGCQHVVIFDINLIKAKRACDELSIKYGKGRIIHLNVDITNEWEFETAFQKVRNEFQKVDILVYNPDIIMSIEIKTIISNNMSNSIKCTEIGIKLLEPDGILLNICRINTVPNLLSLPYYESSTNRLLEYTKTISRMDHRRYIRILSLNPGHTEKDAVSDFIKNESISQENLRNVHTNGEQMLDSVGRVALYLIRYGENGTTYSVNNGNLRKITQNQEENTEEDIEYN